MTAATAGSGGDPAAFWTKPTGTRLALIACVRFTTPLLVALYPLVCTSAMRLLR